MMNWTPGQERKVFKMTQGRKRYDRQFKASAAKVVLSGEMTVKGLSEKLGIKDSTLRRWACEYEEMGDDAFPGNGSPKINKDYEIVKLKKKVEELERENEILKKFPGLLEPRPCVRFEFLKEHRGEIGPIKKACGLMKASKSGFSEYLSRKKSNARIEREALEGFVVEAFHRHKSRYGYRRINRELRKSGIAVSEKRVLRIMQKPGLAGKGATRKRRIRKKVEPGDPRSNLVERAFSVGERNRLWVGGIACMPAREGWLYLAAAIDAFSRKVAGRSMSERITEKVAIDAIGQAVGREDPPDDGSLVFHDDQGAQYTSRSFQRCLGSHGIAQSASRPGTPLDNAVAESSFRTLKRESMEGRSYGTGDEAKRDIFKRIEPYYDRVRMHPALGYMSPVEYERQYA